MISFRIRDIFLASFGLLLFSPLILLIILLLWFTQGKVFFTQLRPGYKGKAFKLIKFSTLYDAPLGQDEAYNQQARLTPIGKYLRKTSLDELPQLINVLKGDMSLIGPRPLLIDYLPLYNERQQHRHDVLPGITGLAQVNGRNALSFKERFEYDLWYVSHKSHWVDLKIMIKTVFKVFLREGVYVDGLTTSAKFDGTN